MIDVDFHFFIFSFKANYKSVLVDVHRNFVTLEMLPKPKEGTCDDIDFRKQYIYRRL